MKKAILLIPVLLILNANKVKAQTDTLAVLQNIIANKSNYIGQPFSALLNQLPIQLKYFSPSMPYFNNRYKEHSTRFSFYFPLNSDQLNLTRPRLEIYWQAYLDRNASLSLFNLAQGAWSSSIASYYSSAVIADIRLEKR